MIRSFQGETIFSPQRGIMMVMLLVVITLVSIISLAVLPFFGTVRERAVKEDVQNQVELTRRAIFLAAAALNPGTKIYDGEIQLFDDSSEVFLLGTADGEKKVNETAKKRISEAIAKGYMRSSGMLRNQGTASDPNVLASAYDRVNFTVVHNFLFESNFEFAEKDLPANDKARSEWRTGGASDAAVVARNNEPPTEDEMKDYARGVKGEHPNSFKFRDFRMDRNFKGTANVTDPTKRVMGIAANSYGGKFGNTSISIRNPDPAVIKILNPR